MGRLAPGATVARVNEQVSVMAKAWAADDPARNHDRGARAVSDFRYRMENAGTNGLVLFAIVASVVLLAAVNVAHLLLARAITRGPEVALRLALGARRVVLARQLLIENFLLCLLSLLAGTAVAAGTAALLPRLMVSEPAMLVQLGSGATGFQIDWRVFSFASAMAMATMLLLALVPLRQVSQPELLPAVQASAVTRTGARAPMARRAAIWLQIAISFALLVSTGTLVRSFLNTRLQPLGLTREQVLLAWTQEPEAEMRDAIVTRMRALPGVEDVAYAIRSPLSLSEMGIAVHALLPSHPEIRLPIEIKFNAVSRDFLNVTGTRIVRGRGFAATDGQDDPAVVIINQTMAQKYWPGQDPIGQVVNIKGWSGGTGEAHVVGVAENAPINRIGELPEPYLYVPYDQYAAHMGDMGEITFALHTAVNAMSMAQPVRQVLIHTHPLLDPMMVTSLPELMRYSAGEYQMMAELVTALGFIGLALTIVGLYGYLAFRVTQRRREIGIRMALGASREATSLLVFRDTAGMALIGLALGVVLAVAAARLESSLVFGVSPLNALSIAGALGILALAVAAAAGCPRAAPLPSIPCRLCAPNNHGEEMMNSLLQDIRYALRQLRKSPGFTITVVLTLALGIGANAAIFTLFDQALLRMLPVEKPKELVRFHWSGAFNGSMSSFGGISGNYFSYPMYKDLRDKNQVFSGNSRGGPHQCRHLVAQPGREQGCGGRERKLFSVAGPEAGAGPAVYAAG